MPEFDLAPIKTAIESYIPLGRSGLLPALHAAQTVYGWLPEEVAVEVARSLHVPLADVHGVIEFYSLFYNKPLGKKVIRVCTDQACALKNAKGILDHLCFHHGLEPGQTTYFAEVDYRFDDFLVELVVHPGFRTAVAQEGE